MSGGVAALWVVVLSQMLGINPTLFLFLCLIFAMQMVNLTVLVTALAVMARRGR